MRKKYRLGEFDLIERYFKPLTTHSPGALALGDDAAIIPTKPNRDIVTTVDAMVAGVHFFPDDAPDIVARKLLRVNLSDLASMGATPLGYVMTNAWPGDIEESWIAAFSKGLANDQSEFDIQLLGGDTVRTSGPLTLSLTAFGEVERGKALLRRNAVVGDGVYVSGTVGDSALGLRVISGQYAGLREEQIYYLRSRYDLPQPRLALGRALINIGHGVIDISDGLLADLQHVLDQSDVGAVVDCKLLPLSEPAQSTLKLSDNPLETILTGGDDYELLFTAELKTDVEELSRQAGVQVTRIGEVTEGRDLIVYDRTGAPLSLSNLGYQHL